MRLPISRLPSEIHPPKGYAMNPQERDLLTNLVTRLRQSPPQQRDSEAESMINDLVREKPDTPYVLAQTVLIQDYALHQAQSRIADLEQQLRGQPAKESGGFLSSIFGGSKPPAPAQQPPYQQPAYQQQPSYAPAPAAGPWGQAQQGYAPQGYAPQGQPSFLRSAATTAAGIAGGALLFQGIESLMGGHGGFGGGFGGGGFGGAGFMPQPGITETVVNNYYGDDAAPGGAEHAGFDNASLGRDDNFTDASFDDGGFDNSSDFGGNDNSI
jgi:hypothetical protein